MGEPKRYAVTCMNCGRNYAYSGACVPVPPCPHCASATPSAVRPKDIEEALGLADEILELVDEMPDAGAEFGESVAEKARDIAANIEAHNRVTEGQLGALQNMLDGVQRWFHD